MSRQLRHSCSTTTVRPFVLTTSRQSLSWCTHGIAHCQSYYINTVQTLQISVFCPILETDAHMTRRSERSNKPKQCKYPLSTKSVQFSQASVTRSPADVVSTVWMPFVGETICQRRALINYIVFQFFATVCSPSAANFDIFGRYITP